MPDWKLIRIGLAELWDEFAGRTENPDYDADWRRRPAPAEATTNP